MDLLTSVGFQQQLRVGGIEVRAHTSFIALLVLFVIDHLIFPDKPLLSSVVFVVYLLAILIHELGHLFAAAAMRVKAREVIIYPFGAITSYIGRTSPGAEIFLNCGGLLASLAVSLVFLPFCNMPEVRAGNLNHSLATSIVVINGCLALINLFPLAALDAGRMLRAALALWQMTYAHVVIRRLNQFLSFGAICTALIIGNPLLFAGAAIVTLSSIAEFLRMQTNEAASGFLVRHALIDRHSLTILPHRLTLAAALPQIIKSFQQYFPVLYNESLIGVLSRDNFLHYASTGLSDGYIVDMVRKDLPVVNEQDDLAQALDEMFRKRYGVAVVVGEEQSFRGLLVRDRAVEFLLLEKSIDTRSPHEANDEFML